MKLTRFRAAVACSILVASGGLGLSAQGSRQPPARPETPPAVQAPADREPVEQAEETGRFRFRRPILRVAQDYTVGAGEEVRAVTTILGDAIVEGHVEQDVVVVMGSARLAGTAVVDGSLVVVGGSATIEPGASIGNDLVVVGGTLTTPPGFSPRYGEYVAIGAPWLGDTLHGLSPWVTRGLLWGRLIVPDLAWIWAMVGIFFLVYLALNTVFDRPVAACADVLAERPLSAFLAGLLVLILALPALAIIAVSVIGLALVPFLLCALVVAALVGKTGVDRAIGRSLIGTDSTEGRFQAFLAFVIGFALLVLAYMVPVLGFVTWALTSVLGLGAASVTFRALLRRERPARVRPAEPAPAPPAAMAVAPEAAAAGAAPPDVTEPAGTSAGPVAPPSLPLPPPPSAFRQGLAQYPRATFLDRVAAFALDCVLVAIANALLDMSRHDSFFLLLLLAYHIAFWAWRGTTLGGIICNLKVVRTDGAELRPADALVRGLSSVFSIAALGIGVLWMLQDPERQMWHDKIAGTLVVKVPRQLVMP